MFVPKDTYAGRVQNHKLPEGRLEPKPADSQHSQNMPARKNQHIALDPTHATRDTLGPRSNLLRRFSIRAAVMEQLPVGVLRTNLRGSQTFELAVVPFDQIVIHFGDGSEAGEFAGASRTLQRTGENLCKSQSGQPFAKPASVAFPTLGQRHIGQSRVLSRETPGGLAVPRQINRRKRFVHGASLIAGQISESENSGEKAK